MKARTMRVLTCLLMFVINMFSASIGSAATKEIIMSGGLPSAQRWTMSHVKAYLRLPKVDEEDFKGKILYDELSHFISDLDGKKLAEYELKCLLNREGNASHPQAFQPLVSMTAIYNKHPLLRIHIYDSSVWNRWCDILCSRVTISTSLWNNIPCLYSPSDNGRIYTLHRLVSPCSSYFFVRSGWYVIRISGEWEEDLTADGIQQAIQCHERIAKALDDYIVKQAAQAATTNTTNTVSVTNTPSVVAQP